MRRECPAVTVWDEATPGAPRVVMVYGPLAPGPEVFAGQRPLAELFRLELTGPAGVPTGPDGPDSGGPDGPDPGGPDGPDPGGPDGPDPGGPGIDGPGIAGLLGHGAHLVGHCAGATAALRAAAAAPHAVRSLTLIEPCALRATRRGLRVRPAALLTAHWPKLIVNGAPGGPYDACRCCAHPTPPGYGEQIADALGARHLRVDEAGHAPQRDRPDRVNAALRRLWQG